MMNNRNGFFQIFQTWINRYFSDPQVIILGFLLLFGFVLVYTLGEMLTPLFISIVIAYLLDGMIVRLQRFKIPRLAGVIIVYCIFIACVLIMMIILLPLLSRQIAQFVQVLPKMIAQGQTELMELPKRYPQFISESQIQDVLSYIGSEATRIARNVLAWSVASVKSIITLIVYLILVPLLVFFCLKDKQIILEWIKSYLPEERKLATEVWIEVNTQISNYIRGKIMELLIVWAASYITFSFLKLNFTMLVSFFIGLSVMIPYIGATVMTFPVAFIAWFQWGWSPDSAYALIAYGILQLLDGNILAPLLLSEVVNLHPIAIITAVLIFGGLWGIWGLFFAIPLATLVHSVIKAWFKRKIREKQEGKCE